MTIKITRYVHCTEAFTAFGNNYTRQYYGVNNICSASNVALAYEDSAPAIFPIKEDIFHVVKFDDNYQKAPFKQTYKIIINLNLT
jgi:hypothetical protein